MGPTQIAKRLKAAKVSTPTEHWISIGRNCSKPPAVPYNWCSATVADILGKQEYCGDTVNLQQFIRKVKKITELKALTPELIHEFVEKIVVYAPKYLDGRRIQIVDIYYNGVGILDELTPDEMEESSQKSIAERKKTETA